MNGMTVIPFSRTLLSVNPLMIGNHTSFVPAAGADAARSSFAAVRNGTATTLGHPRSGDNFYKRKILIYQGSRTLMDYEQQVWELDNTVEKSKTTKRPQLSLASDTPLSTTFFGKLELIEECDSLPKTEAKTPCRGFGHSSFFGLIEGHCMISINLELN